MSGFFAFSIFLVKRTCTSMDLWDKFSKSPKMKEITRQTPVDEWPFVDYYGLFEHYIKITSVHKTLLINHVF